MIKRILSMVLGVVLVPCFAQGGEKLNILFLFADDQCFETISAYGLTDIYEQEQDRAKELFQHFLELQKETGDTEDVKSVFPELLEN